MWTVVSVDYHYKNPSKRVGLVQSGRHNHLIECSLYVKVSDVTIFYVTG